MRKVVAIGISALSLSAGMAVAQADQSGAVSEGYGAIRSLGLVQDAWNAQLRERGASKTKPGYVRYLYSPDNVYPVRTRESMITTIKLPDGERLTQAFSGDDAGFQVAIPSPGTIAIKALYPGVDTNVVAYTEDGKVYSFYVRSEGYSSKTISDFLVDIAVPGKGIVEAGMEVPAIARAAARAEDQSDAKLAERVRDPYSSRSPSDRFADYAEVTDFNPNAVVEDLAIYAPKNQMGAVLPYRIFRDDRFTYIDYGPNASQIVEWPTVSMIIQGVESPIGFRTAGPGGRMIVIEALGEFVLRNGQRILCIKRKGSVDPKDKNFIGWKQLEPGEMQIPSNLPPGRPAPQKPAPLTVTPISNAPPTGTSVSPPSRIVPLPVQIAPTEEVSAGNAPALVRGHGIQSVIDRDIRQIANREREHAATVKSGADHSGEAKPAVALKELPPSQVAVAGSAVSSPPASAASVSAVIQEAYILDLGRGPAPKMQDRWKSFKVQYYNSFASKKPEFVTGPDGQQNLHVGPFSKDKASEVCAVLGADREVCTVIKK